MNFWILVAGVSLSVYALIFLSTLFLIRVLRPLVLQRLPGRTPKAVANRLLALRTFPFFFALAASAGLTLPAFLGFEPRSTGESLGPRLWILSLLGFIAIGIKFLRALRILWNTAAMERHWLKNSTQLAGCAGVPVYCVDETSPLLVAAGIFRPRIFVSREVKRLLSDEEFSAALAHELAHVRLFDNLKQLALKVVGAPRWLAGSETYPGAWTNASEAVADDAALRSGASALELASALLRVARLKGSIAPAAPIAVSHLLPDLPDSCLKARIERLEAWIESPPQILTPGSTSHFGRALCIAVPIIIYAASLSVLLPLIHDGLELLVR
jgi:Zn-dependent protease with chaperone function